jgi:hypothetical protein
MIRISELLQKEFEITLGESITKARPMVSSFQLKPKPERDCAVLTQKAAAIKNRPDVPSSLSWLTVPGGGISSNKTTQPGLTPSSKREHAPGSE